MDELERKRMNYVKYSKTKRGVVSRMYNDQKKRTRINKYKAIGYDICELREWLYAQPLFHELYDNWVASGYKKDLKPSVDRKDDYKGYSFDNIQLMTCIENVSQIYADMFNGINTKGCRTVMQYDKNLNVIEKHYSISSASRKSNTSICGIWACCNEVQKTSGGYKWEYV